MLHTHYEDFYSYKIDHLTLAQALAIHYALNPQFTVWNHYTSLRAQKLVKAHDITHIVFGCDTSLLGEMRVQLWSKFAVQSFGWQETLRYAQDKEAKVLLKNPVGYLAMFRFFVKHLSEIGKVRAQAQRMDKKWIYFEEEAYMSLTVGEIRRQFNIVLL
jgi:hypothetical protein